MEEVGLILYEDESFIKKVKQSIFSKRDKYDSIISKDIDKKRKSAIKQYILFKSKDKKKENFVSAYNLYTESINDYVINTVYERAKEGICSQYDSYLLSKYYSVLTCKDREYYEYKFKKQILLLNEDYDSLKKREKISRDYKKMYYEQIEKAYRNLFVCYNDCWINEKNDVYCDKILDTLCDFFEHACSNILKDDEVKKYLELLDDDDKSIMTCLIKGNLQIHLIKKYLSTEINVELIANMYEKIVNLGNIWLDNNINSQDFKEIFEYILDIIGEYNNIKERKVILGIEEKYINSLNLNRLKNKMF